MNKTPEMLLGEQLDRIADEYLNAELDKVARESIPLERDKHTIQHP